MWRIDAFKPYPKVNHYIGCWHNDNKFFEWFCESDEAAWMETYFIISKEQYDEIQKFKR